MTHSISSRLARYRRSITWLCPQLALLVMCLSSPTYAASTPWSWSRSLPSLLETKLAPSNRTATAFEQFFRRQPGQRRISEVLTTFGRPEGYSPQFIHSKTMAAEPRIDPPEVRTGTMRYLLEDGGEVHVHFCNPTDVCEVLRFTKTGRAYLLYK